MQMSGKADTFGIGLYSDDPIVEYDVDKIDSDINDKEFMSSYASFNDSSARTDYYDKMSIGSNELSMPTHDRNEVTNDTYTSGLGNFMSGLTYEDSNTEYGHPSEKYAMKLAVNISYVDSIVKGFLKENKGEKNLTRRHVTNYLSKNGINQYMTSDVVRYLKYVSGIDIEDDRSEFPTVDTKFLKSVVKKIGSTIGVEHAVDLIDLIKMVDR